MQGFRRPVRGSSLMATVTGVWHVLHRRIGNAKPMITPIVNQHVGTLRHVAFDTLRPCGRRFVKMMPGRIKNLWQMALGTKVIALQQQFTAMGLMTV